MALVTTGSTKTFNDSSGTKKNRRCFPCLHQGFCKKYGALFRLGIIVATPLLLLPIPLVIQSSESKAAYTLLVVAVYWTTEALPLGITALIPMVLLPMFGIVRSQELTLNYMKENIMLFMAGYMVAMTIEKWNLHKRIALKVLTTIGCTPPRLMFGFMLATMLLSMWISNTATTTMMIPIVEAVLQQLKEHYTKSNSDDGRTVTVEMGKSTDLKQNIDGKEPIESSEGKSSPVQENEDENDKTKFFKNLCKAMCLCISYAACFGGSSTLIGSGAVILGKSQIDEAFEQRGLDSGITFPKWMAFVIPASIICIVVGWLWLQFCWLGFRYTIKSLCTKSNEVATAGVRQVLLNEYKSLGDLSFAEKAVIGHFSAFALLLLTRDLGTTDGWSAIFKEGFVGSSVSAIMVAILLFIFPAYPFWKKAENKYDLEVSNSEKISSGTNYEPLLDMKTMTRKMAWNIVLLCGGGMAIADGCQASGLSEYLGEQMSVLQSVPTWILVGIVCLFLSFFTEFTSNVAVVSIVMPVLAEMAIAVNINPLYLMIPGNIACLYAFMLPVATPPNAIVFSYGHLKVFDMVSCGFIMNLFCIVVLTIAANTWGNLIFGFNTLPEGWVDKVSTMAPNTTLMT